MTIRITQWSPDTCSCVLEYEWDDSQDENTRSHNFVKAIKLCEYHNSLSDNVAYGEVVSENTRKNKALAIIQKVYPEATSDNYLWWFDGKRELQVSLPDLPVDAAGKAKLQADFNTEFGPNKAKVV